MEEEFRDNNGENEQSNGLRTLMHGWSVFKLNFRMVFLNYNIEKHKTYNDEKTELLVSELKAATPDTFFVVRALEGGADPNVIMGQGLERPLHRAAKKANVKIVRYLVEAGADINALTGRHQTPLIIATDSKRTDSAYLKVIRYLANHRSAKIDIADVGGNTALLNGKLYVCVVLLLLRMVCVQGSSTITFG